MDVWKAPEFNWYSNVPSPVAFTTIVPVGVAQVGCVTVGAVITGGIQHPVAALKTTGLPLYIERQVGLLCRRTAIS